MPNVKKEKLRAAIKTNDGWWASIFSGPVANRWLEPIADNPDTTPNTLTLFSLFIGVCAALCFAIGDYIFLILGGILVQVSFIVDCMDGQLARYRQQFSNLGAWLDRVSDRVKDFLYFVSLAFGYFRIHKMEDYYAWIIWPLAMTAFFAIFLIDYYVNQNMKLNPLGYNLQKQTKKIGKQSLSKKTIITIKNILINSFRGFFILGKFVYNAIPILRFNIGEQALLISLFCFFNAVMPMMLCFAGLGVFYLFYWPIARLYGYTDTKPKNFKDDYQI